MIHGLKCYKQVLLCLQGWIAKAEYSDQENDEALTPWFRGVEISQEVKIWADKKPTYKSKNETIPFKLRSLISI
jgi:hypothetical protein